MFMEFDFCISEETRKKADNEADHLVQELFDAGKMESLYELAAIPSDDLRDFRSANPALNRFIHQKPKAPAWLDRELLKQASDFYRTYALEIMMLLGAVSLPTCYAASPGNKVLYISEKIRNKPGKRLLDTASFVISISEPGAFEENGIGYKAVQQVRLIHALARYHILNSGKWDLSWGLPVNQEDMLGTNLAFSYTVLCALEKAGFTLKDEEQHAFLHLWKWVGYLMKIDLEMLTDTMDEAHQIDRVIRVRNFRKSPEGISLTRSLLSHYKEALPRGLDFIMESQIKYLVGKEIGDMLGLKSNILQDLFVRALARVQELIIKCIPHRPSYPKMMKDHLRLKELYSE